MAVRAKFYVTQRTQHASPPDTGSVVLSPVFKAVQGVEGNACEENQIFGKYTPSGNISMTILNPEAFKQFKPGAAYYVDFHEADEFIKQG